MTKPLIIVESPAKCSKIEEYLGGEYDCVASYGHIRELVDVNIKDDFKPKFKLIEGKNLSKLKKAIETSSEVILATDDDREGEAIAWHLAQVYKLPIDKTKRIVTHEITHCGLMNAIKNPKFINMNKVKAQLARQVLDRLVGYTISPILWKYITRTAENSLSAGRCQTPALRLIYENQCDIDNTIGDETYDILGYFTKLNIPFKLDASHNLTREKIENFLENSASYEHILTRTNPTTSERKQPQPFITSTLQQSCSNFLHFSPKETMRLAQTLYENGYITYMRTDSKKYSSTFINDVINYIKQNYGEDNISDIIDSITLREETIKNKNNQISQDAHEAIRPTNINIKDINDDKIGSKEKRLYGLIWQNSLQSCMISSLYSVIKASITSPIENILYYHKAETPVRLGWEKVGKTYQYDIDNETDENNININDLTKIYNYYSCLSKVSVNVNKISARFNLKHLKQHYTEAKLVSLLEKHNIGRPATFSSIIDKIEERKFVALENLEGKQLKCVDYELDGDEIKEITSLKTFGKENKKLVIQPLGRIVIEFLLKHFDDLFIYEYTGNMENDLDKISRGEMKWQSLCSRCLEQINTLISNINDLPLNKNTLDEFHSLYIGKYGPCIKYSSPDKQTKYYKIKKNISVNDLLEGKIKPIDAIATNEEPEEQEGYIGKYNGETLVIKNGKYGPYVTYKGTIYSVKCLNNSPSLDDVISIIERKHNVQISTNIIRSFSNDLSLRKGKYGPYFYYQTNKMKQPKFYKTANCPFDIEQATNDKILQWIKETYGIVIN